MKTDLSTLYQTLICYTYELKRRGKKVKRKLKKYTEAFKREAVNLALSSPNGSM